MEKETIEFGEAVYNFSRMYAVGTIAFLGYIKGAIYLTGKYMEKQEHRNFRKALSKLEEISEEF